MVAAELGEAVAAVAAELGEAVATELGKAVAVEGPLAADQFPSQLIGYSRLRGCPKDPP